VHADRSASLSWKGTRGAGRAPLAAALAALLLAPALGCGGDDSSPNVIIPITATATLDPDPPGDPVIYLQKVSEVGDLVTVNVRLRTSTQVTFDAFNLDVRFDPGIVTVAGIGYVGTILCGCDESVINCAYTGEAICQPSATTPSGEFLLGISSSGGDPDFDTGASPDVILVTLAFRAGAVTPVDGTRVDFISDPSQPDGSCEILTFDASGVVDAGIPCAAGFTLFAQR
jgi:hypothetical protein